MNSGGACGVSLPSSGLLWVGEPLEAVGEATGRLAPASVTGLKPMPESEVFCRHGASRLASSSSMLLSRPAVVDSSS